MNQSREKNRLKIIVQQVVCFSLLVMSSLLLAEENTWHGLDFTKPLYAGIGFTRNEAALISGEKIEDEITTQISVDDSDSGYMLFLGMHYAKFLDIETRYQNLGSFKQNMRVVNPPQFIQTNTDTTLNYQSFNFLLRPKFSLGKYFQVQAETGLSYVMLGRDAKVSVLGNRTQADLAQFKKEAKQGLDASSENKLALTYGMSILYQGNGYFDWRWAIDRHKHGNEELASQSISIVRGFGGNK